ncbi:tannase/feruloyl esterase family alpha/beta hydrolase [Robbsia sp. KACC 23696]|uniref:tannase/feruloyl esterase family alpha/beta hydrolase n=1 Tax=Robbsia sp. KACC 23696 TaxID=3149231 RepID=UPI00325BE682
MSTTPVTWAADGAMSAASGESVSAVTAPTGAPASAAAPLTPSSAPTIVPPGDDDRFARPTSQASRTTGTRQGLSRATSEFIARCNGLDKAVVPAASIGLPTRGAQIADAAYIAADAQGNRNGAYCRIVGVIRATHDTTPDIRFEVNLPLRWNGRSLQMGGGGYSGVLVTGTEPTAFAPSASPLFQGYATYGSDSGHVGNASLANFATNNEAVVNFGYGHLKKTHDVALTLIKMGYGRAPTERYFAGGSTGGREGLTVAQRFPDDYDGIIANAPALNFSGVRLIGVVVGASAYGPADPSSAVPVAPQTDAGKTASTSSEGDATVAANHVPTDDDTAAARPPGFVGPMLQRRVREIVLSQCDDLDGLRDGIVSNVAACRQREPQIIAALRCPAQHRDWVSARVCATPAQMHTLDILRDGLSLPYALAHDVTRYHGYNVFSGVDFTSGLGLGSSPVLTRPLRFDANGYLFAQADGYMKYFVTRDMQFDTLRFDVTHPGRWQPRMVALSDVVGAMNPDLSAFIAHGGKIIIMHGLADEVISPNETIAYYKTLMKRYGQPIVDGFLRLYMVPGFQHGNGVFIPAFDELTALDHWVTAGKAPETLVGADIVRGTNGRTRPMCRYPAYPRYAGRGNPDVAGSFTCAMP